MNRKSLYKDMEKYRATRNAQKNRYFSRTTYAENRRQPWTSQELNIIMAHEKSDMEISKEIGRSVRAIQEMRHRAKRKAEKDSETSSNLLTMK